MKPLKIAALVGGVALGGLGVAMALTNPTQSAYEEYAVDKLTEYVKENVCQKAPFLQEGCASTVDAGRSDIQRIVQGSTQRQDFLLFSIYTTDVSVSRLLPAGFSAMLSGLPTYQFETVGVFQSFYTYKAGKK